MATAQEAGQLITLLLKLTYPKKTIEIGLFTGYSLVLTALTIPDDGKASIIAIDLDQDAYEMELPIIKKVNIEHKINFIQSSALSDLDEILNEECVKETMNPNRQHIIEFNKFLYSDTLVQISQVLIGDGITICWQL
uniref:caffeoyl-CoA O-methyltransferase n=1 Tax=Solanum lycopersicum TaxID=4081 RepID=K4C0E6_SOLLC